MLDSSNKIIDIIRENGGEARYVGGWVRDFLLGKKSYDIDIATNLTPIQAMGVFAADYKVIPIGIDHGTITVIDGNINVEITSLRRDIDCDGRHAKIEYTNDWEQDAARRDFTINAIFMDKEGNIYDYFGGKNDLELGIIRFVGDADKRIKEDYLRIFRFFRFFTYYGKKYDEAEIEAIKNNLDGIKQLSGERIQAEMMKLLASTNAEISLKMMMDCKVMEHILLDLNQIPQLKPQDPLLKLCILARACNNFNLIEFSKRWRLSNKITKRLSSALNFVMPADIRAAKILAFKNGKMEVVENISIIESETENNYQEIMNELTQWEVPIFDFNGDDIKKLGIKTGKKIGELLQYAEKSWIDSDFTLNKNEIKDLLTKSIEKI